MLLQADMAGFDVAVTGIVAGLTMLTGVVVQPFGKRLAPCGRHPSGSWPGQPGSG